MNLEITLCSKMWPDLRETTALTGGSPDIAQTRADMGKRWRAGPESSLWLALVD
jgi:hypothetical protein